MSSKKTKQMKLKRKDEEFESDEEEEEGSWDDLSGGSDEETDPYFDGAADDDSDDVTDGDDDVGAAVDDVTAGDDENEELYGDFEDLEEEGESGDEIESGGEESEIEDDVTEGAGSASKKKDGEIGSAEAALAIKCQNGVYGDLLELLIKSHQSVQSANKLPQSDTMARFAQEGGAAFKQLLDQAREQVLELMSVVSQVQSGLMALHPDTADLLAPEKEGRKRKQRDWNLGEACRTAQERHDKLKTFRDACIRSWNEKTQVFRVNQAASSFSSFDQSILDYINRILLDKDRLVKRTKLQRSSYRILGKERVADAQQRDDNEQDRGTGKERIYLDETHDDEIFDDDDFYQHLLREMVERCSASSSSSSDSTMSNITKLMLEAQVKSCKKRKIDSSYNKERKIKYIVHPKLLNFTCPIKNDILSEETKTALFKTLFCK